MSDKVRDLLSAESRERLEKQLAVALQLKNGDGDGTSGGMEARVAKLEAHMQHVLDDVKAMKADVSTLKTDLAAIKVQVAHLPTKEWMSTTLRNWTGFAVAMTAIFTFAMVTVPKLFDK